MKQHKAFIKENKGLILTNSYAWWIEFNNLTIKPNYEPASSIRQAVHQIKNAAGSLKINVEIITE